jgi:riboflavin biosynthesis pyrimidine reductase
MKRSVDLSIETGMPTILSGASSMKMTHVLRTLHDGIIVGIGTVLADNPSLNARLADGTLFRFLNDGQVC